MQMKTKSARIAELNDRCRLGVDRNARIVVTRTCLAHFAHGNARVHAIVAQAMLLRAVRNYRFGPEDRPERDRGIMVIAGTEVRFRIDYYDSDLEYGSEDPSDPNLTVRVLTIMLPEDD